MNQLTQDNSRFLLAAFIEENDLNVRQVSKAIGCSEATLIRILAVRSLPSDEMIKQIGIMIELGFVSYSKLSNSQKERISESIGTVGGGILGFGSITAAVSSLGAVSGLSAAGITSGLGALGAVVSGGMAAGIMVAAAIPIAAGAAGYAIIKGVKYFASEWQLNVTDIDEHWEIVIIPKDNPQS
ncbi:MAG: hypothetical protein JW757_05325 [Anaerolineales bacterium]|nr:hypothetical protein [Anaerolineales bacterium]